MQMQAANTNQTIRTEVEKQPGIQQQAPDCT
jgi:hypothetical protein